MMTLDRPLPAGERSAVDDGWTALILGATGLVGGHCLELLLEDPLYGSVRVLARRPLGIRHPKLSEYRVDFGRLEEHAALFAVDDVFSCLGTTIRKAGSREAFRKVDVEYPAAAARLAAAQGARQYLIVTAVGADPESRIPYNRDKGEVERLVLASGVPTVWIFRPSLLLGDRDERRTGEKLGQVLLPALSPLMIGPLRRYRPIPGAVVAAAMVAAARSGGPGRVVESEEIAGLGG